MNLLVPNDYRPLPLFLFNASASHLRFLGSLLLFNEFEDAMKLQLFLHKG